jgi:hypothetical protein
MVPDFPFGGLQRKRDIMILAITIRCGLLHSFNSLLLQCNVWCQWLRMNGLGPDDGWYWTSHG